MEILLRPWRKQVSRFIALIISVFCRWSSMSTTSIYMCILTSQGLEILKLPKQPRTSLSKEYLKTRFHAGDFLSDVSYLPCEASAGSIDALVCFVCIEQHKRRNIWQWVRQLLSLWSRISARKHIPSRLCLPMGLSSRMRASYGNMAIGNNL